MMFSSAEALTSNLCKYRPSKSLISSRFSTALNSTPKKKRKVGKAKKKKLKKKKAEAKDEVEYLRKPQFVESIAEKTGMSKQDSEAALAAVLETISEVSIE